MSKSGAQSQSTPLPQGKAEKLVATCRDRLVEHLQPIAAAAIEQAASELFAKAERASSTEQGRIFASIKVLERGRDRFVDAIAGAVAHRFSSCVEIHRPEGDDDQALELVDEDELEQNLAISDFVARAELKYSQPLYGLNQRMSVLDAGRPMKGDANPLGPRQIGKAIQIAAQGLDVDAAHKVRFFRVMDRQLIDRLGPCYDGINELLIEAGILPNLKFRYERNRSPSAIEPKRPKPEETAEAVPTEDQPTAPRARPEHATADRLTQEVREESAALLDRIHALMAKMHHPEPAAESQLPPAPTAALDDALQDIQGEYRSEDGALSAESIRRRLDRRLAESGLGVASEQRQAIDLVGMVHDYVRDNYQDAAHVQNLFEQLQVPLMRVALHDGSFFKNDEHPARQFINTVAEASELWLDDHPEQSETLSRMQQAVSRVLEDYQGDLEVFGQLLEELKGHIGTLARKSRLAEERQIAARKGQERLAVARVEAGKAIDAVVEQYDPPDIAVDLLRHGWHDYLALLHLREGDESAVWQESVALAKYLALALSGKASRTLAEKMRRRLQWFRSGLGTGLSQVGYSSQDTDRIVQRVEQAVRWSLQQQAEEPMPPALSEPLVTRAVERAAPAEEPEPPAIPETELTDEEKAQLARLRLTPFGTWFEIKRDKLWIKRKLSWYSPMSGRCLFVNNQGHPEELSMEALARMLVAGDARRYEVPQRPLFDRAMHAVFGRLKRLVGAESTS